MNPLLHLGARQMAQGIARGDFGALELLEAHIQQLEAVNTRLNAVTARRFDAARAEARAIDQRRARGEALPPLAGVPISVKDSVDLTGTASTFGLPWRRDELAPTDDPHVARLRAAGAIPFAKSNVAQLLLYIESDNPLFGRTLNPFDAERTPGGSSGGEAALIASHASPLGLGSDIGGSIRVPAHFCGVAGFKPTQGRCPDLGRYSVPLGQTGIPSQLGPLARRVEDLHLALSLMQAGPGQGVPALLSPTSEDVSRLRIGWFDDDGLFPAAPAIRRAVREAAQTLAAAGASVVPAPALPWGELYGLAFELMSADGGAGLRAALRSDARHPSVQTLLLLSSLPPPLRALLRGLLKGLGQPTLAHFLDHSGFTQVRQHWPRLERLADLRRRCDALLEAAGVDMLLGPPCSLPAVRHGASRDLGVAGSYAMAVNVLGWPAGCLPWTQVRPDEESDRRPGSDLAFKLAAKTEAGSAGLPVGVQLIGRPWQDHRVLAAMQALQDQSAASPSMRAVAQA